MKITTIIPEKVKLSELKCGTPFSYKLGGVVHMVVAQPAFLHERLNCEPQVLDELVYYCELFCGWVYFCTKAEAENIMVYKLKPANGSLMFEPVNT